jgi:hypothetical protein
MRKNRNKPAVLALPAKQASPWLSMRHYAVDMERLAAGRDHLKRY